MDVGQFRLVGGELSHSADRAKQLLALYHSGLYANQLLLRLRKSHGSRGHVLHAGVFVGVLRHQVHPVWRFAWLVVVVLRAHGIVVVENLFLSWSGCMGRVDIRSEEHTSELQSRFDLVCRLLLEKKKRQTKTANAKPVLQR